MKNQLFVLLLISILFTNCVQISSLQTAKTLPEGDTTLGMAIAAYGAGNIDFVGGELGNGVAPHLEIFARRGIANNFDGGLKLSSAANIALDAKYQFFGNQNSEFALAVGAAFEYQYSRFENFVSRQTLPIYASFHPNENLALYASAKFIHQLVSDDANSMFLGGNIGLQKRINQKFSLVVEGSNFVVFNKRFKTSGELIYYGGIGFLLNLK